MNVFLSRVLPLAVLAAPLAAQTTDEVFKLRPKSPANLGGFGTTVATTDAIAVVGAALAPVQGEGSGAAFVFDVQTGQQLRRLLAADGGPHDHFGRSVAVEGGVIAVGADDADGVTSITGAAYVFDAATGAQTAKLVAPDGETHAGFGSSVALDGGRVLVGAPGWSAEKAYLFDATTGALLQEFTPEPGLGGWFGRSVALHGDRALVGAPYAGGGGVRGAAYLFDAATGSLLALLEQPTPGQDNDFGRSVALNDQVALVGAPESHRAGTYSGAAYLYDVNSGGLLGALDAASTRGRDGYGYAVAISGDRAVVGAWWHGNRAWDVVNGPGPGMHTGMAYVFDLKASAQVDQLLPKHVKEYDLFGAAVAVDADTVVAGSYWRQAAYVFR